VGLIAVVLGVAATAIAVAAAQSSAPTKTQLTTPESVAYKINHYVQFGLRWNKDTYVIRSGGTLSFKNLESDEPHTFSVVKPSQMPRTTAQLNACNAVPPAEPKNPTCRAIYRAHAPDKKGNPKHKVVNNGKTGIDGPGDSLFIPPKNAPQPTIKVTAAKGTTLNFLCLVHPWMQAKLQVQ
jgi:hypothetical protein